MTFPSQVCTGTWIYANDQKTDFNQPGNYSVSCVVKDGNLRIGAEIKSCTGNYVCIDNFRLSYKIVYADIKDYLEELVASVDQMNQHDGKTRLSKTPFLLRRVGVFMQASKKCKKMG